MSDVTQPDGAPAAGEAGLEERLAKAQADSQKYLDNWRRAEADLQNYKKRAEQERDESRRFSSASLIINLLPIVDDFERAFIAIDNVSKMTGAFNNFTWFDGLRLIYRKLVALLENAGVRPIQADGQPFDPRIHEAVAHVDGEEGKVLSEVQRGYMLHDRVLRPAMVVVGRGTGEQENTGTGEQGNG